MSEYLVGPSAGAPLPGFYGEWDGTGGIMPLWAFPEEEQAEIRRLVEQPKAPKKWLAIGPADIPSRAYYEWWLARGRDIRRQPLTRSEAVSARLRQFIIDRDGLWCRLCGDAIDAVSSVDIDHILPVFHGGKSTPDNLQVTHAGCNRRKGARIA